METTEKYFEVHAKYIGKSIYGCEDTKKVTSKKLQTIDDAKQWINEHKRHEMIFGMGDIDYPKMSECHVYEITKTIKEIQINS